MHDIAGLDPSTRSAVRAAIFRVLRDYATGGKHGPIYVGYLFQLAADYLAEARIVQRPSGTQRFWRLTQFLPNSQLFPNWGIDRTIADLMRHTFWELYRQGVLAPGPTEGSHTPHKPGPIPRQRSLLDFDCVRLTPYGVEVLTRDAHRIQAHDPDGYLADFWGAVPEPDRVMMRYLAECIRVFGNGHLLATVVLLGVASDRLIDVLAEKLCKALGTPYGGPTFQKKYEKLRNISERFRVVAAKLMGEYGDELADKRLKDRFQKIVTLSFEVIRDARNSVAHPDIEPRFTWNKVGGLLHIFVPYFQHVSKILKFLNDNPR